MFTASSWAGQGQDRERYFPVFPFLEPPQQPRASWLLPTVVAFGSLSQFDLLFKPSWGGGEARGTSGQYCKSSVMANGVGDPGVMSSWEWWVTQNRTALRGSVG